MDFKLTADLMAEYSPMTSIRDAAVRRHAESLYAETERWIWKAIAQGVGNRVWRSNPIQDPRHIAVTHYQFAILKPGEPSPAGVVFGPFSKA